VSKLSEKFAAGKKAVADRQAIAVQENITPAPSPVRVSGPTHGAVSTMKIEMLKGEVEKLRTGKPEISIDPKEIRPSEWANRHVDSFKSDEFVALKAEIKSAGKNTQAIKVRPIKDPQDGFKYEVVFGHRRHRACLEEGLEVIAVIEDLDDKALFIEMDRENRQRSDLRPYEQGVMYARALDKGIFPSIRKLAEDAGADATLVSRAVGLARMPQAVLDAFQSRLDIQYRWASELKVVIEKDPDVVLARAADISSKRVAGATVSSQAAFSALVGKVEKPAALKPKVLKVGSRVLSISERNNKVSFELDKLAKEKLARIEKFIAEVMAE
jgi:ParB family chromosome partitioning protein